MSSYAVLLHRRLDDDGRVQISRADFTDPRLSAFLQAHLDDMEPTAPPDPLSTFMTLGLSVRR